MPATKRYRKRSRRPSYRRRSSRKYSKRGSRGVTVSKSVSTPIPDRMYTRLKYSHISYIDTAATPQWWTLRLTNLYDPDYTGTGHQPLGYDQWATFYKQYRVIGVSFRITPVMEASTAMEVGFHINDATTAPTTIELAREKPFSKWIVTGDALYNGKLSYLKGYCSPSKILGISKMKYNAEDAYTGYTAGTINPKGIYLHMGAQDVDRVTVSRVRFQVDMYFRCVFFDRIALASS